MIERMKREFMNQVIKKIFVTIMLLLVIVLVIMFSNKKDKNIHVNNIEDEYKKILNDAPAIIDECDELNDASFSYEMNLEKFGKHYDYYACIDINNDNNPELIALSIINFRWTQVYVYTYMNDKIILLKDKNLESQNCTFDLNSSANGSYYTYICESGHIHNVWSGDTPIGEVKEDHAYLMNDDFFVETKCNIGENNKAIYLKDIIEENN